MKDTQFTHTTKIVEQGATSDSLPKILKKYPQTYARLYLLSTMKEIYDDEEFVASELRKQTPSSLQKVAADLEQKGSILRSTYRSSIANSVYTRT